jgi:diphthamide biosynthesis protein 2
MTASMIPFHVTNRVTPGSERNPTRRRYLIERARESRVVGIVAGTLGVAGYLTAIAKLRKLIADSGRKSYTVVAGKPNPQKLANFPEIEAFVLVACEQAALIDGRDYLQPVITPWEAEVAFTHGKHWDGEVRLDFEHLLEPGYGSGKDNKTKGGADGDGDDENDEDAEFSFLGGGVRAAAAHTRKFSHGDDDGDDENDGGVEDGDDSEGDDEGDGVLGDGSTSAATTDRRRRRQEKKAGGAAAATQLAVRAEHAMLARAAGSGVAEVRSGAEYLLGRRTYTGLEPGPKRGEDGAAADAPLEAAEGLKGRAHGYSNERS